MNLRIRPDDLQDTPYRELLQTLAIQWAGALPPAERLTYQDYVRTIATLLLTTQNPERTRAIVQAVLDQADALKKSSVWVEQELKFEGMIDGADRADFLRFELSQASEVDDRVLDSYNERMKRVIPEV